MTGLAEQADALAGALGEAGGRPPRLRAASELLPRRPYPGLRPFQQDEWPIFRGRDRLIQDILDILAQTHFVSVIGPSGSGKSSLVKAGVIATLERRHGRMGVQWRTATMRPGASPLWSMADGILRSLRPDLIGPDGELPADEVARLRVLIDTSQNGLAVAIREFALKDSESFLLLVDQFEEIFRYRSHEEDAERARLIDLLLAIADHKPSGLYVITTMRSEYLGDCARFSGLAETLNETHYLVPRMRPDELRQAIIEPAELKGGTIQKELVERLIGDLASEEDQLPILQHTLLWMWIQEEEARERKADAEGNGIRLNLADYIELETVETALSRHGDRILCALTPEERRVGELMFRRMIEVEEGRSKLRRPTRCGTVAKLAEVPLEVVQRVVDAFRADDASFIHVTRQRITDDTSIDITHESLIRQWSTLDRLVRQERASHEVYDDLCRAAQRRQNGLGTLLQGLGLSRALYWAAQEKPTRLWARRYGGDFDAAIRFLTESEEAENQRLRERKQAEEEARRQKEEERERRRKQELEAARLRAAQAEAQRQAAAERAAAEAARAQAVEARRIAQRSKYKTAIAAIVIGGAIAAASSVAAAYYLGQMQTEEQAKATARALALRGKDVLEREGASNALLTAIEGLDRNTLAYVPEMEALAYQALQQQRERRIISTRQDQVGSSQFAPRDGTLLTAGADGWLRLWDPVSGGLLDEQQLPEPGFVRARWRQDSQQVLAGYGSGGGYLIPVSWRAWGPELGDPVGFGDEEAKAGPGVFSPDGSLILTGSIGHPARLWDATVLPPRPVWKGAGTGMALAFSADGKRFATGGNDGVVRVYDTGTRQLITQLPLKNNVFSLSFHPHDADTLLATSLGGKAFLWNMANQHPEELKGHQGGLIFQGAFSPDGRYVATASEDDTVRLWRVAQPQSAPVVLRGHTSSVFSVDFHPTRPWLASASSDKTVRIWNVEPALHAFVRADVAAPASGSEPASAAGGPGAAAAVDGPHILAEGEGTKLIWDDSTPQAELRVERGWFGSVLLATPGDLLKPLAGWFGAVILGKPRDLLKPVAAAISPDGGHVLVAPDFGWPLLYDLASPGAPVALLGETEAAWRSVEFEHNRPVGITTSGERHTWTYLADRQDLGFFARLLLPLRDGKRVELGQDRLCNFGLVPFEQCPKSATLASSNDGASAIRPDQAPGGTGIDPAPSPAAAQEAAVKP